MLSHPGQAAAALAAVVSKYPVQVASRSGSGVAVGAFFTPYVGAATTAMAGYRSAFKAAHQNPGAIAIAAVVGEEMCP